MSDYESESAMESDGEMSISKLSMMKEDEERMDDDENFEDELGEEGEETDFLESFVTQPFEGVEVKEEPEDKLDIEIKTEKDDDFEYDIKEKLKEMGEISFETVKKGDKPKKVENSENEVIVTATKKSGKSFQ